jgi:hypothetical protein
MTQTKTNSSLEIIHDYLEAIQLLHYAHKREYDTETLHPEIHSAINEMDLFLLNSFDAHTKSPLLQVATEYPYGTHSNLRTQVKEHCKHKSVQDYVPSSVEIDKALITRLFYKYHLNQSWLSEFWNERRQDIQVILQYLHELLVILDLSFQLRGIAKVYG